MKPDSLFFDIDGTLISSKNPRLSPCLIQALQQLKDQGMKLCISSGRSMQEIEELKLLEDFEFDALSCLNGAIVYAGGKEIFSQPVDPEEVKAAIDYVSGRLLPCMFVEKDRLFINRINGDVIAVQQSIHSSIPPVKDLEEADKNEVLLITPYFEKEKVDEMMEKMPGCKATSWHPLAYDLVNSECGKIRGVQVILDYFSLKKENAMAFGDGENDLDMLAYAGIGVAMGQAGKAVKAAADYVTADADDEGLLKAFRHFLLLD